MGKLARAAVAYLALCLPAAAGDLIEYRTPDGRTGYANDASLVPAGAEVVRWPQRPKRARQPTRPRPLDRKMTGDALREVQDQKRVAENAMLRACGMDEGLTCKQYRRAHQSLRKEEERLQVELRGEARPEQPPAAQAPAVPARDAQPRAFAVDVPTEEQEAEHRAKWLKRRAESEEAVREAREHAAALFAAHAGACKGGRGRSKYSRYLAEDHDMRPGLVPRMFVEGAEEEKAAKGRCAELKHEVEEARAQEARLRDYLEEGLEEECRRAPDCLPGYLRE